MTKWSAGVAWSGEYVPVYCSLCGKSQDDVQRLVAVTPDDDRFLCNECITLLYELITEE